MPSKQSSLEQIPHFYRTAEIDCKFSPKRPNCEFHDMRKGDKSVAMIAGIGKELERQWGFYPGNKPLPLQVHLYSNPKSTAFYGKWNPRDQVIPAAWLSSVLKKASHEMTSQYRHFFAIQTALLKIITRSINLKSSFKKTQNTKQIKKPSHHHFKKKKEFIKDKSLTLSEPISVTAAWAREFAGRKKEGDLGCTWLAEPCCCVSGTGPYNATQLTDLLSGFGPMPDTRFN